MRERIARRDFLRLAGLGLAAPLVDRWPGLAGGPRALPGTDAPVPALGRVTVYATYVRETASPDGTALATVSYDDVLSIVGAADTEGIWDHNPRWYQTPEGYVYSSFVQPVEDAPQAADWNLPATGFWAEVSRPHVDARTRPDPGAPRRYRLYYSSVYRVVTVAAAADGSSWYGLAEWELTRPSFYAPAESLRRLGEADLAPISPGADKAIKIFIGDQRLEAYEGGQQVFTGRIASGASFFVVGGVLQHFHTPLGQFRVLRKAFASHMTGGTRGQGDYYDLPGVPFCTYFTRSRVAIHGAYWHNDYGRPRSHGCVNMLPGDARWIYRWAEPAVAYDSRSLDVREGGTPVEVVY
jgi:hypothetical protein